jgi:hypothetical protein
MDERRVVVAWVLREIYNNDLQGASKATGFTVQQLTNWRDGIRKPQKNNVSRLMHHAFEPAFTIIAEFKPIEHDGTIKGVHNQLSSISAGRAAAQNPTRYGSVHLGIQREQIRI